MCRMILALCLMMPVSGCMTGPGTSGVAICDGSRKARADHAAALAASPDDRAVITGARLVALIDAGCQ